ncbi:MAG: hypothetical protein A2073_04620 [Deltaproteobacteria bacterium GWC2_42_11]|nr:MAG: hypothetical protein A2073_04620 [Deltaproteobacteria bacterium GWC2_42_11]HBO83883.1 hypothetical protein [Deltaproteobacteria bacterium]
MKDMLQGNHQKGFTLLEVIIAIIVASVLGVMFISFMGTSFTESVRPVIRVQDAYTINQVMENMTADYKKTMTSTTDPTPLTTFKTKVDNGNNSDNVPYYGTYAVLYNNYIALGDITAESQMILKVTISQGDQKLTALFTR